MPSMNTSRSFSKKIRESRSRFRGGYQWLLGFESDVEVFVIPEDSSPSPERRRCAAS